MHLNWIVLICLCVFSCPHIESCCGHEDHPNNLRISRGDERNPQETVKTVQVDSPMQVLRQNKGETFDVHSGASRHQFRSTSTSTSKHHQSSYSYQGHSPTTTVHHMTIVCSECPYGYIRHQGPRQRCGRCIPIIVIPPPATLPFKGQSLSTASPQKGQPERRTPPPPPTASQFKGQPIPATTPVPVPAPTPSQSKGQPVTWPPAPSQTKGQSDTPPPSSPSQKGQLITPLPWVQSQTKVQSSLPSPLPLRCAPGYVLRLGRCTRSVSSITCGAGYQVVSGRCQLIHTWYIPTRQYCPGCYCHGYNCPCDSCHQELDRRHHEQRFVWSSSGQSNKGQGRVIDPCGDLAMRGFDRSNC